MNPPSVYELTKPRSHSTSRITNMVQSIRLFLSLGRTYLRTSHFCCAYRDPRFLTRLQSDTQIPVVRLEQTAGRLVIALSQLGYDPHGAIAQFCARSVQVDHEIAAHFTESNHCTRALLIFCTFDAAMQRRDAARDYALHQISRCATRRRDFARVQNTDASASPGSDVKQATTASQGFSHNFNRASEICGGSVQCVLNEFFFLDK